MQRLLFTLLFFASLNLNLPALAGEWSSGGGDPIYVKALPFPNQATLQEAIDLLKLKIRETPYYNEFKKAFLEDLEYLQKHHLFFYIPDLFSVGLNRFDGDYDTLVSNGAMTEFSAKSPIYFSRQAVNYDARTLARVIAQEIPHHIFSQAYGRNELFVNALGTYIIVGGEPPTSPIHFGQVIYEEFINHPGERLKEISEQAQLRQTTDWRWMNGVYFLARESYKERGSYSRYNIQSMTEHLTAFQKRQKVVPLQLEMELTKEVLKKCTFLAYTEGPSGITQQEQKVLTELFLNHLRHFASVFKGFYYAEEIKLASERELSTCAFGIQGPNDQVLWLQGVYLMNDDQVHL